MPIGYGIKKMQITAVIEDAKVESMDAIIEGKCFPLFFPSQETSQKTHLFSPFVLPPRKKNITNDRGARQGRRERQHPVDRRRVVQQALDAAAAAAAAALFFV